MKIAFLYHPETGRKWNDGLAGAMSIIEKTHQVLYCAPDDFEGIGKYNPDVLLRWGAVGDEYAEHIKKMPHKKALLYAGGMIEHFNHDGFDLYFVENEIDEVVLRGYGHDVIRAFGVNEKIFRPMNKEKVYDGVSAGALTIGKRHDLVARALGEKCVIIGEKLPNVSDGIEEQCLAYGAHVLPVMSRTNLAKYFNSAHTVVVATERLGGGQRCVLEAMACNVPPSVTTDNEKTLEFVYESGFGYAIAPQEEWVRSAVQSAKLHGKSERGRKYVLSKWTVQHYADNIMKGLSQL